jgi:hypothetical protein
MIDKIILAHYVSVDGLATPRAKETLISYSHLVKSQYDNDNIISYIIPTKGESKIECIYPTFISTEKFEEAKTIFDKFLTNIKNISDVL